jgi:glycosyltransferase involved in cell wall biosynthesis
MPSPESRPLSIIVMTYNEESNIGRCLNSVEGLGDEIVILDSYSTDRTVEIASAHGARIEQYPFDSYINQKNRLIQFAEHDWVLNLDADEYLSPGLRSSIEEAKFNTHFDGYTFNRRNKIGDTWVSHGNWYPDRKIRLFDRRKVVIIGKDPHDIMQPMATAYIGHLKGDLMHIADESISSRYRTIERHSTRAAEALYQSGKKSRLWRMLLKPFARFSIAYFLRLGFLDGYYGWIIAKSEADYVWLREVKLWEQWKKKSQIPSTKKQIKIKTSNSKLRHVR